MHILVRAIFKWLFILSVIALVIDILWAKYVVITPFPNQPPQEKFGVTSFSPDSKKMYLEFANIAGKVRIGWMELSTRKVSLFEPQNTQDQLFAASSSADGKQLAIVIKEAEHNFESSQIGILDLKSKTYRAITHGYSYRQFPSFSRDGKKIIYASPNHIRASGHTRFSGWDIYEVDIDSGIERQLTEYCFFAVTYPFYLGDGNKFVFYGEYPDCNYPSPGSPTKFDDYFTRYHENGIFMRSIGKQAPLEPLFQNGDYSSNPFLTQDGKIFFVSRNEEHVYNIYVYKDGAIKRLSDLSDLSDLRSLITDLMVSPQGDLAAYRTEERGNLHFHQWLMDVKSGKHSEIDFGDSKSFQIIKINQLGGERK